MKSFLSSCWDTLLQLTAYAHFLEHQPSQQPIPIPPGGGHHDPHAPGGPHGPRPIQAVVFPPQNASAGFTCQYPSLAGWQACNSASDRSCWLNDPLKREPLYQYNISTDYESFSPPGVVREYWLNVSVNPISPDGYVKPLAQIFNNTYPGPLLEACWGDQMVIHVTNLDNKDGHTTHWHGIRQLGTNEMDGVNGVTQCPIAQNSTFTYRFNITQYGHTWYHSHYQVQYSDGAAGPLTLYGPTSDDYDEAFPPILVNDWVHANASNVFLQELNGGIPVVDNIILDGKGTFLCSDLDPLCCSACHAPLCTIDPACKTSSNINGTAPSWNFTPGTKYLLRLTCASAESMFLFSIDGHNLTVIATDLVPIKPYTTSSLFLGIGQRYDVIVEANPIVASSDGNYWVRTRVASGCGNIVQNNEKTGVVRYNQSSTATPTTPPNDNRQLCQDEPVASLVPIVPWQVTTPQGNISQFTYEADQDPTPLHGFGNISGFVRWDLLDQPLFLNYSNPSILHVGDATYDYPADYAIVDYNFTQGYVWLVITGQSIAGSPNPKKNVPAAHPIHLHGHDFVILDQKNSSFTNTTDAIAGFNFNNPPRRDVALLYAGGYLALAFKPDNPGVWLVHCHIAWHASSGLAMQILENQPEILSNIGGPGALDITQRGCKEWEEWDLGYVQVDSGI